MLEVFLSDALPVFSTDPLLEQQGLSDEIDALRDIETSSTAHTDAVSPQSDLPMTDFTSGIYDTIGAAIA